MVRARVVRVREEGRVGRGALPVHVRVFMVIATKNLCAMRRRFADPRLLSLQPKQLLAAHCSTQHGSPSDCSTVCLVPVDHAARMSLCNPQPPPRPSRRMGRDGN